MSDFDKWWEWYKKVYPSSIISREQARKAYDEWYFCDCQSCTYRKENGHIPIYAPSQECKLPAGRGDLNYVRK